MSNPNPPPELLSMLEALLVIETPEDAKNLVESEETIEDLEIHENESKDQETP